MYDYDRPLLKRESKQMLRANAPGIYLGSLVFLLLSALPNIVMQWKLYPAMLAAGSTEEMYETYWLWSQANSGLAVSVSSFALDVFLAVIGVGFARYCLRASRGEETGGAGVLFGEFGQFWRILAITIIQGVFVFLWSLLFVIPGIIKAVSYSQSYRLLLDNPDMTALECISESSRIMRGHKWEFFVLQLSFIGWMMLVPLTFGVVGIWLEPYIGIANAGFYNNLVGWQPAVADDPAPQEPSRPSVDDYWKS